MVDWTKTKEEYEHVRHIMVDNTPFGNVEIHLKNGAVYSGLLAKSSLGNNVGENLAAGKGPAITSIYGEFELILADKQKITLSALDVAFVRQV